MLIYKNCKAFYLGEGYWNITGDLVNNFGFESVRLKGALVDVIEHINIWQRIRQEV